MEIIKSILYIFAIVLMILLISGAVYYIISAFYELMKKDD